MPRRYKQGADGQPHPAFYGKLPEEFSKADTMRFMVETDLKLSGCLIAIVELLLPCCAFRKNGRRFF